MKRLTNRSGMTLVEIIVVMAIAGLFMVSAVALIFPMMKTYLGIISMNRVRDVTNIVQEKIIDELSYVYGNSAVDLDVSNLGADPERPGFFTSVNYRDKSGNPVEIHFEEGRLLLTYGKIEGRDAYDWYFDKNFYKGCTVNAWFKKVEGKNCLNIILQVVQGEHVLETNTYVECIDIEAQDIKP